MLDHDVDRSEPETGWTLVAGWAAIASLGVQRHPDPQQRANAALILRCAGSAGLLVDEFSVRFGEGQLRGPDPRGSDVRTAARNRKRTSRRARKRVAAARGEDQGILGVLLRALVDSLRSSIASDETSRPMIADLEMFAVNSATLFANLAELERRGRLQELFAVARAQLAADLVMMQAAPAAVADGAFPQRLVPDLRRTGWWTDALWELVGALCEADGVSELDRVLDRFLDRVASGPPVC